MDKLRGPLDKHPRDVDISMLMWLCDIYDILLATNYSTASILIKWYRSRHKI